MTSIRHALARNDLPLLETHLDHEVSIPSFILLPSTPPDVWRLLSHSPVSVLCFPSQLYTVRNEVVISIGTFLSNGPLTVPDDPDEAEPPIEDDDPNHPPPEQERQQEEGGQRRQRRAPLLHSTLSMKGRRTETVRSPSASPPAIPQTDEEEVPLPALPLSESVREELFALLCSRTHDVPRLHPLQDVCRPSSLSARARVLAPSALFTLPAVAVDRLLGHLLPRPQVRALPPHCPDAVQPSRP